MRLKHGLVCTVLLVCAGVAEAGFFESLATTLAERAVALDMDRYNLDTLAVAYLKNKQYDEAVQTVEKIIAYWQSQNPGKPVPAGQLKRYKKLRKEAGGSS